MIEGAFALLGGPWHFACCALLVVVAAAARGSTRLRQLALLAASWLFYLTWGWPFLALLITSSLLNYGLAAWLRGRLTRARLWAGLALNIALLAFFKYATPILADEPGLELLDRLVRPMGLSFWTLQAMSYLFDVYQEEELDPSIVEFCLYMAFWPTVVMGPIMRLSSLLPQFREPLMPASQDVSIGLSRILTGLFMKLIVAEILGGGWTPGGGVNAGFDRGAWGGLDVWLLAIGFGCQLYFDFAGYSHIVIGAARVIGIRLDENFAHPFRAPTPAAFWTRWHMSLSFWFRDYMFLPLASLRRGRWWTYASLMILMVTVGLWHQAAPLYLAWGAYHGGLLVAHRIGQQIRRSLRLDGSYVLGRALSSGVTFLLVSAGWIFFRATSISQAEGMFAALANLASYGDRALPRSYYAMLAAVALWSLTSVTVQRAWARWRTAGAVDQRQAPANFELYELGAARAWWWLAPVVIVIGIFGGLAVHDLKPSSPRTPFMYTLF